MVDFVSILKAAIDKHGASESPEVRARIYDKAREAVGGRSQTRSPSEVEAYSRSLEAVISEVEGFYEALAEVTLQNAPPVFSENGSPPEAQNSSPDFGEPETQVAATRTAATEVAGGYGSFTLVVSVAKMNEPLAELWGSMARTLTYELEWSPSSACSTCRKWAVCIDSAHCWQRN
jgi:hypothetical protein